MIIPLLLSTTVSAGSQHLARFIPSEFHPSVHEQCIRTGASCDQLVEVFNARVPGYLDQFNELDVPEPFVYPPVDHQRMSGFPFNMILTNLDEDEDSADDLDVGNPEFAILRAYPPVNFWGRYMATGADPAFEITHGLRISGIMYLESLCAEKFPFLASGPSMSSLHEAFIGGTDEDHLVLYDLGPFATEDQLCLMIIKSLRNRRIPLETRAEMFEQMADLIPVEYSADSEVISKQYTKNAAHAFTRLNRRRIGDLYADFLDIAHKMVLVRRLLGSYAADFLPTIQRSCPSWLIQRAAESDEPVEISMQHIFSLARQFPVIARLVDFWHLLFNLSSGVVHLADLPVPFSRLCGQVAVSFAAFDFLKTVSGPDLDRFLKKNTGTEPVVGFIALLTNKDHVEPEEFVIDFAEHVHRLVDVRRQPALAADGSIHPGVVEAFKTWMGTNTVWDYSVSAAGSEADRDSKRLRMADEEKEPVTCSICLDTVAEGERSAPPCGHAVHWRCLDPWRRAKHTCPECRSVLPHPLINL